MEATSTLGGIVHALKGGDIWMYPILLAFVTGVALTIERFIRLYFQYGVDGTSFMFEVQKYVLANDVDGAIRVCNGGGSALLPKILKAGLQRASRNDEQIQNALDAASLEAIPQLERNISYLALVANVATLLGLLGTISGLITTFGALSAVADPSSRQEALSKGIATAMNATAFGLITAIFTMIAHSVLSNKAARILSDVDEFSVKLLDLLSARKSRHTSERAGE